MDSRAHMPFYMKYGRMPGYVDYSLPNYGNLHYGISNSGAQYNLAEYVSPQMPYFPNYEWAAFSGSVQPHYAPEDPGDGNDSGYESDGQNCAANPRRRSVRKRRAGEQPIRALSPLPAKRPKPAAAAPKPKGPKYASNLRRRAPAQGQVHLWYFVRTLLNYPQHYPCIKWEDREQGIFRIVDKDQLAFLWGQRTGHPKMIYENLARSLRTYYRKDILLKAGKKNLQYRFLPPYCL